MANFSKKTYEFIANAIRETGTKQELVRRLKREFANDNPHFKPDQFTRACGLSPDEL